MIVSVSTEWTASLFFLCFFFVVGFLVVFRHFTLGKVRIKATLALIKLHSQLCPHVVIVVGLDRFSDPWGYAGRAMPDRPKVRDQTKRDMGVYAVHGRSRFTSGTRPLIRRDCTSDPATT